LEVGFIGLGNQGLPMAQMIERAGWPLTIWTRRPQAAAPFEGTKARAAASLRDLAAGCDAIGVCVSADADVLEVVLGETGLHTGLRPGAVVMIHSTVLPETCLKVAEALAGRGVGVLDMPVSGSGRGAFAKTLTVMAGGDRALFDRVSPICESYGQAFHLGPLGSGQRMKLLNNTLFTANLRLAFDALDAAQALGLDIPTAEAIVQRSSGASYAMGLAVRFQDAAQYPDLERPRRTLKKDLGHYDGLIAGAAGGGRLSDLAQEALDRMAGLDEARTKG
jgi:3-hydroxyisobutyrate dehydrogenase-like beta-hydroxyacid dehydrogenase